MTGNVLKSNTATASFQFNQKNDNLVPAVHRDEYFVCSYDLNAQTSEIKSYSSIEDNLEKPTGINPVNIRSGITIKLCTVPFKLVKGAQLRNSGIVV